MKRFFREWWPLVILGVFLAMCVASGLSQSPEGVEPRMTQMAQISGPAEAGTTYGGGVSSQAMVALILPLLLGMVKGFLPEKYRKWIPLVAPLLGELFTQLFASLPGGSGAVAGLAGVGVREAVDNAKGSRLKAKGESGGEDGREFLQKTPVILFLFVAATASGCAVLDRAAAAVTRPGGSVVVTNEVVRFMTNVVAIPVPVPGSNVVVTNFVDRVVSLTNREVVTNVVYEVKPEITKGLAVAETVGVVAPQPYGTAITIGVGLAGAAVGALAARRNRNQS